MNERIKELAFAATDGSNWKPGLGNPQVQEYMEKFAELIVRECAHIAYEYDAPKMSGPGMIIAGRIETHFGVEE